MLSVRFALLSAVVVATSGLAASGASFYGPTSYLSAADSPFSGYTGWVVDNLEDGSLMAGISTSAGAVYGPASNADSVDADDGAIDGHGTAGHSFFNSNGGTGIRLTFDAAILGALPKSAGLVWTDGSGTITFEAFDENNVSLGTLQGNHADGSFGGQTAEDRFYGASNEGGIKSIFIKNTGGGIEIDHIQFAFSTGVPAPSAAGVLAMGAFVGFRRRR